MLWGDLRNLVFQCGRKIAFFPGNQKAAEINCYDTESSDLLCGFLPSCKGSWTIASTLENCEQLFVDLG